METRWVPTGTTSDAIILYSVATAASTMEGFTQIVGPTVKVYDIRPENELCVRECAYIYMYIYMYIYIHVHVCMYACMHVCMYACMHVGMLACRHVGMYACMHVCM